MEIYSNVNTIQNQMNQFNNNASKIANAGESLEKSSDISKPLTDNISLENGLDAQVNSIKTQDEMIGSLLNIVG